MTLRDLKLQWMYASPENVYKEFFNKVLKESDECMRFGGVFSSRTFADCASGMQEFVQNNGKMKLILVSEFSDEDVKEVCLLVLFSWPRRKIRRRALPKIRPQTRLHIRRLRRVGSGAPSRT